MIKDVDNTVNFYSSRDEVVANGNGEWKWPLTRRFPCPDMAGARDARPYQTGDSVGSRVPRDLDAEIAATAQAILDARARYPESSLADLYDPLTMPPDLRAAHEANDRAVLAAYGLAPDTPEPEIVAHLFKLYAEKVKETK